MRLKQHCINVLGLVLGTLLPPSSACNRVGCIEDKCEPNGSCKFGCRNGYTGSACNMCVQGYFQNDNYCFQCLYNCIACTSFSNCTSCNDGYYGEQCNTFCPIGCFENKCFKDDGKCSNGCKESHYGEFCNQCSPGCYNNQCDGNGVCTHNCINGYIGDKCDSCQTGWLNSSGVCIKCRDTCDSCTSYYTCSSCVPGYHGTDCTLPCSEGCSNNICDKFSGQCTSDCIAGYYGGLCTLCSRGCTDICDSSTGHCTCKSEYSGSQCTNCLGGWFMANNVCIQCPSNCLSCSSLTQCSSCRDGYYGNLCEKTCPQGCLNTCYQYAGHCNSCKSGFTGDKCCVQSLNCQTCSSDTSCLQCKPGFYGVNCEQACPVNCNRGCVKDSGQCSSCKDGFSGMTCEGCIDGFYGDHCDKRCMDKVTNCLLCNVDKCTKCNSGFFPGQSGICVKCSVNCLNGNCSSSDDTCLEGCREEYWGPNCSNNCPNSCQLLTGSSSCDAITGECSFGCSSNKHGKACDKNCSNTCFEDECDWRTGFCTKGCVIGYYGKMCKNPCNINCVSGSDGSTCDDNTGTCRIGCKNGFYGERCQYICGNNCANVTCSRSNGDCIHGCTDGFEGVFCVQAIEKSTSSSNTAPFVAGVSAGVGACLIIAAVATAFYVITKRRKRNNNADQNLSSIKNQPSIGTDLALNNIADSDNHYEELGANRGSSLDAYQSLNIENTGRDRSGENPYINVQVT